MDHIEELSSLIGSSYILLDGGEGMCVFKPN
jgi:hypothetical protein